jgi:hypothetical protein
MKKLHPAEIELRKVMRPDVKRGAELLDKYVPEWYNKINGAILDGVFNMNDFNKCALGTLELVTRNGDPSVQFNGTVITSWTQESSTNHGFCPSDEAEELAETFSRTELEAIDPELWSGDFPFVVLDDLWKVEVKKRVKKNAPVS